MKYKRIGLLATDGLAATLLLAAQESPKTTKSNAGGPEVGKRFPPFPKITSVIEFSESRGGICVSCLERGG